MEGIGPAEYESLTGITKAAYEDRLLTAVRQTALAWFPPDSTEASVESVELEGDAIDRRVVILFRIPACPERVFGCRARIWPRRWSEDVAPTPEDDAEWILTRTVDELVTAGGLVVAPGEPGAVTWLP